jgi:hypothetical protein
MTSAVSTQHVIEVFITSEQLARALARVDEMEARLLKKYGRAHLNDSIRAGYGVFTGLLGEEVVHDFYAQQWDRSIGDDIYHWDLRDAILGRIDVKTKLQNYDEVPRDFYNCTVCDANVRQLCDWYCFARIHKDCERAWLLGFMPKKAFFDIATFGRKGEVDPTSHNGWKYKWDCWNVPVSKVLRPPVDLAGLHMLAETHVNENS